MEDTVLVADAPAPAARPDILPGKGAMPRRSSRRRSLLLFGLLILVAAGLAFYLRGGRYETTDDAFIQAGEAAIAANVSGQVIAVDVRENQRVRAGQVLFRIDPQPFQTMVDQAQAQLADARAQVNARRASYHQGQAEIASAQARLAYATGEAARQKNLRAQGISSQDQYDQAVLAVQTQRFAVDTSSQQVESIRAMLAGNAAAPTDSQPAVRAAQAALDRARLDLGYTAIRAVQDGVVTHVTGLQPGNYVMASKPVFTLVALHCWVEANFKESQLANMRIGQRATVTIDAYPDHPLHAHLTSFSPGTGSSFSLLPAENASGNWVKVVQRLPAELEFDAVPAEIALHAGLSASVSVDTRHVRHLFGPDTSADASAR